MAHAAGPALIAIVDDDDLFRRSIARLVRASGWRVETFGSAEDYLARGDLDGTSCAILDMKLPGMSGLDLQRQLAARRRPTSVVFVSAHDDVALRDHALREGAVAFLRKPFEDTTLLEAIDRAVTIRPARRE